MKATYFAAFVSLALALAGAGAQAQTAAHNYDVQVTKLLNGQDVTEALHAQENQPFTVSGGAGDKHWRAEFVLTQVHEASANGAKPTVRLAGTITEDGRTLAKPALIGWLGERMGIKVGDDVQLAFVVNHRAP